MKNVLVPINTLVAETTDEDLESVDIVPGNILASPVASEVSVEVKGLVAAEADSFEAKVMVQRKNSHQVKKQQLLEKTD